MDLFTYKPAPRTAIRESSKRRMMALTCLNIAQDNAEKAFAAAATAATAAAATEAARPAPPGGATATVEAGGGDHGGGAVGREKRELGINDDNEADGDDGVSEPSTMVTSKAPQMIPTALLKVLAVPPALAASDLLRRVGLTSDELRVPQGQYLAVHPAGGVINFQISPGGATSWVKVLEGAMVRGCTALDNGGKHSHQLAHLPICSQFHAPFAPTP